MPDIGSVLAVNLEARINQLEKQMKRASDVSAGTFDKIERRSKESATRLENEMGRAGGAVQRIGLSLNGLKTTALNGVASSALLAVAPMLSLGAAISGAKAALDKFGDIADKSAAAGVDPEFFQGIAYQAKLSGVEIDAVASALAGFAKNAGLAAEGKGRMVSTLQALNPELLKNIQAARTQEERIRLVADAIKNAKDQAQAAAIATAAFGDSGTKLVAAFKDGGSAIDDTIAKAKALGLVVDRDVIEHADELGDKFDTVTQIIDVQLKSALVNLAPVLVGLTGYVADWMKDLNIVLDQLKAIEDRTFKNPLQNRLIELENRMAVLKPNVDAINSGTTTGGIGGAAKIKEYNDALAEALRLQERIAELDGKPKDNLATPTSSAPLSPVLVAPRRAGSDGREAHTRHDAGDLVDGAKITKAVTGLGSIRTASKDAFGALRSAATDASVSIGATDDAIEKLHDQFDRMEGLAESFVGKLIDGFENGRGVVETLGGALGDLGDQLLRMGANAVIQSLFSSLMGGNVVKMGLGFAGGALGLAGGGEVRGPGTSTSDSIPAMLSDGEHVINAAQASKHRALLTAINEGRVGHFANGGPVGKIESVKGATSIGGTTIAPTINVNVEGGSRGPDADKAMGESIAKQIDAQLRSMVSRELQNQMRPGNLLNNRAHPR